MTTEFTNNLSPAEAERIAILLEEAGEIGQECGKITTTCGKIVQLCGKVLRHGFNSAWPADNPQTNRKDLEREIGNLLYMVDQMVERGDLDRGAIEAAKIKKADTIKPFVHHQ